MNQVLINYDNPPPSGEYEQWQCTVTDTEAQRKDTTHTVTQCQDLTGDSLNFEVIPALGFILGSPQVRSVLWYRVNTLSPL